ncbi:MAG: NADH-quinone oxidoreductase subunit D, partial [Thermoleophilaceae bacterium]|nr:NADH-quinone oxidoreductase subunit D [Thermoleophilaceae bacterium]
MTDSPSDGIGIPADPVNGGPGNTPGTGSPDAVAAQGAGHEGEGGGSEGGGEMPPGERTQAALKVPYREREASVTSSEMAGLDPPIAGTELEPDAELLTINIGPHHPATHGVLRLLCTLEGETVLDLEPIIGYVHTGIEKSCEDQE